MYFCFKKTKNKIIKSDKNNLLLLFLLISLEGTVSFAKPNISSLPPLGLKSDGNFDFDVLAEQAKLDLEQLNHQMIALAKSVNPADMCSLNRSIAEKNYVEWFVEHHHDVRVVLDSFKLLGSISGFETNFKDKIKKISSIEGTVMPTSEQIRQSQEVLKNLRFDQDHNLLISLEEVIGYFNVFNSRITNCSKDPIVKTELLTNVKAQFMSPFATTYGFTIDQAVYVMEALQQTLNASLKDERYEYYVSYTSPMEMDCRYAVKLTVKDKQNVVPTLELSLDQKLLNQPWVEVSTLLSNVDSDQAIFKKIHTQYGMNKDIHFPDSSALMNDRWSMDAYERYFLVMSDPILGSCANNIIKPEFYADIPYISLSQLRAYRAPKVKVIATALQIGDRVVSNIWTQNWFKDDPLRVVTLRNNGREVLVINERLYDYEVFSVEQLIKINPISDDMKLFGTSLSNRKNMKDKFYEK